jgi:hypothetical protein
MEPLISYEGYSILQNSERSHKLLNNFYIGQGYVIRDKTKTTDQNKF